MRTLLLLSMVLVFTAGASAFTSFEAKKAPRVVIKARKRSGNARLHRNNILYPAYYNKAEKPKKGVLRKTSFYRGLSSPRKTVEIVETTKKTVPVKKTKRVVNYCKV